ncbi:MAG: hypothetical protein FWH21_03530, partial [Kiritimatiellaeota bacterium]|nr:hypothetical protein [Kiritimatiellota bacterium]
MFERIFSAALPQGGGRFAAPTLPGGAAALAAVALAKRAPPGLALVITPNGPEMERVHGDLCALERESGVTPLLFPQQTDTDPEGGGLRMRVMNVLSSAPQQHARTMREGSMRGFETS